MNHTRLIAPLVASTDGQNPVLSPSPTRSPLPPSALGVCPQQCSLPAESVAASGRVCPVRQGHRASPAGDLHARGHQGLHHLTAGVGPRHPQVRASRIALTPVAPVALAGQNPRSWK